VLAVVLTLVLAKGVHNTMRLLLAGVVVGVVLGAAASLVLLMNPDIMQAMQSFMLGSTAFAGWNACCALMGAAAHAGAGLEPEPRARRPGAGEATAHSLGLPLAPLRLLLIVLLALATGTAVAQTG
jgi:iron complex transport system permease protein